MADEFDFDAPVTGIADNTSYNKTADRGHDAWFSVSHGHLLRPALSKAPRRVNRTGPAAKTGGRVKAAQGSRLPAKSSTAPSKSRVVKKGTSTASAVARPGSRGATAGKAVPKSGTKSRTARPAAKVEVQPGKIGGTKRARPAAPTAASSRPTKAVGGGGDLAAQLAAHNSKFRKAAYEPRAHSVRDVKRWERATGQEYATLSYSERGAANSAIAKLKAAAATRPR